MGDDDDDRGWPLGEAQIRAKYYALVKRDVERAKELADTQMRVALPTPRATRVLVASPPTPNNHNVGLITLQEMLALDPIHPPTTTKPSPPPCPALHAKRTKFLAKQFKLISNSNSAPRRNVTILAKSTPLDHSLQERSRVHQPSTDHHITSPSDLHSHTNSPGSVISEASVPETVLSSEPTKLTRERWTSREIFGSFDFGGELDIDGSITVPSSESSSSWSSDGSRMKVTSPSSLFREGNCYVPRREQVLASPRKLSRKLSTSFNKRRRQGVKPVKMGAACNGSSLTVEIAGLLSGFKVKANKSGGNGQLEATTAFQDDIAQLMLDRSESGEIGDIEEFLDGYMRLRSPFYLEIVEEFFRTVSYDCYRRPLEVKKLSH